MPILREFLDWKLPALKSAAEYLRERFGAGGELNLEGVVVVVPGGRAGRRLLEILVDLAAAHQLLLTPPAIVTPDSFPETLYEAKWPFADVLTQRLAWVRALANAPAALLHAVLPKPPVKDDVLRWLAVSESLRRLHLELAADGIDCQHVLNQAGKVEGFAEQPRWEALCKLQRSYLDALDELKVWDVQTARLVAIQKKEIQTDKQLVLVGTADLNLAQRQMLSQVAANVTALVVAPAALADRFDAYGCLLPEKWADAELPLQDEQIERVQGPAEQAESAAKWLASLDGNYRADEIAIGIPDERLVPQLERQLAQCGLAGRAAVGRQLAETGPFRLLRAAAEYASRRRFRDLAALVRHPDVFDWLTAELGQRDLLGTLDRYAADHFPAALDPKRLDREEHAELLAIWRAVERVVEPLLENKQKLAEWSQPLLGVLAMVYRPRILNRDDPADRYVAMALEALRDGLEALVRVPDSLAPALDARQACSIVLTQLQGEAIPPPSDPQAIELLGWLDLPLDDSPATLVTTFNEGFVPGSITADAFLPNRLRQSLGLMHNDRRLARDAYAVSVLCASRKALRFVVARRDGEENPLAPTRLLFLTGDQWLVARARKFFGELPPQPPRRNLLTPREGPRPKSIFERPLPQKLVKPIEALSVTKFRDYIACPYRFYLRHQLGLEPMSDASAELDGGAFGGLAHNVLEQFGRADEARGVRQSADPEKIAEYLDFKLDQMAAARFGPRQVRPAVLIQLEQIRLRLRAFARWQAQRTADGWRIVFGENTDTEEKLSAPFPVDNQPFSLTGRIDRVDYHHGQRRLAVLDYKTADRGDHPQRTHRRQDEWIDLQLPLYRHLVRKANFNEGDIAADAAIDLGYILLPVDLKSVGLQLAEWNEALLHTADEQARMVIRGLRQERFWPPTNPPPDFFDDVAVICQDRAMGANFNAEDEAA